MKKLKWTWKKICAVAGGIFGCGMLVSCYGVPVDEEMEAVMYGMPPNLAHGTVFEDKNNNNIADAGEGIPGIKFVVSADGKITEGETNSEGGYSFSAGLPDRKVDVDFTDPSDTYKEKKISVDFTEKHYINDLDVQLEKK